MEKDEKDQVELPKFIGITTRDWSEFIMYYNYRILRVMYVSTWFYFIPFMFLIGQYGIPFFME